MLQPRAVALLALQVATQQEHSIAAGCAVVTDLQLLLKGCHFGVEQMPHCRSKLLVVVSRVRQHGCQWTPEVPLSFDGSLRSNYPHDTHLTNSQHAST